eukprot:447636_1
MVRITSSYPAFGLIIAIFIAYKYNTLINQQQKSKSNNYIVLNDFVSDSGESDLMKMYEDFGDFASSKADFSSKLYFGIGEGYEPTNNGSCLKHGTLLHKQTNQCLFLPRLDAVSWYMKHGGFEGWKGRIPSLTSRLSSFIRHEFNAYNRSEFQQIFQSKLFKNSVSTICPKGNPYFKPIELNLLIVLPGQGLLAHHDAVYFVDATRHQFPLWLLSVMKESNLFNDKLIHQVQAVVYVGPNNKQGGELYIYPNGVEHDVYLIPPTSKSAVLMDGTEIVHGTIVYQPDIKPLSLWQNTRNYLRFDYNKNVWRVWINEEPTEHIYEWKDVRASIAFRALCFEDKNKMETWNEYDIETNLTVDGILNILKNDLIGRNRISEYKWNNMNKYNLGLFLMKEYVKLPKPE